MTDSAATGNYSAGATWVGGIVPTIGVAPAVVKNTHTVTVDAAGLGCGDDPGAGNDGLTIESGGILNYSTIANSDLTVRGDITVAADGTLYSGTQLGAAFKHSLIIDCVATLGKYKLTAELTSIHKPKGYPILRGSKLAGDVASGQKTVTTADDVQTAGWAVGDLVALPSTDGSSGTNYKHTEIGTIASFNSGTSFEVTVNWVYTHLKSVRAGFPDISVVLLDRNVVIRSAAQAFPAYVRLKCQTDPPTIEMKYTEYKWLGVANENPSVTAYNANGVSPTYNQKYSFTPHDGCSFHDGDRSGVGFPGFVASLHRNAGVNDYFTIYKNPTVVGNANASHKWNFALDYYELYYGIDGGYLYGCDSHSQSLYTSTTYTGNTDTISYIKNVTAGGVYAFFRGCPMTIETAFAQSTVYYTYALYHNSRLKDCFWALGQYGHYASGKFNIEEENGAYYNPGRFAVRQVGSWDFFDTKLDITEISNYMLFNGCGCQSVNDEAYNHVYRDKYGYIKSCDTVNLAAPRDVAYTGNTTALMMEPENASNALTLKIPVPGDSGSRVTVQGVMQKTAAYNGADEPSVTLSGMGMTETSMAYDAMTVIDATWRSWVLTGVPTQNGVGKIEASCIGTAGYVYISSMDFVGPALNIGDLGHWYAGLPAQLLIMSLVDTSLVASTTADVVMEELVGDHDHVIGSLAENIKDILADVTGVAGSSIPTVAQIRTEMEGAGTKLTTVKTQTNKMNFSGNNIQSRVADKGALNNPPSENIADYKADISALALEVNAVIMKKMVYNKVTKSGDIVTVYKDDGVTPWKQFNLAGDGRVEV